MLTFGALAVLFAAVHFDDGRNDRSRRAGLLACGVAVALSAAGFPAGDLGFAGAFVAGSARPRAKRKRALTPSTRSPDVSMISQTSDVRP